MAKTGIGAVVVFSGGITLNNLRVRGVSSMVRSIDALDDTAQDSTDFYESCPDDLQRADEIELETFSDLKLNPPLGTVGTLTISYPKTTAGSASAATISGTGFISKVGLPAVAPGGRLMTPITWTWDGKTGPTFTLEAA